MSRLFPEELQIGLAPDAVCGIRRKRGRIVGKHLNECADRSSRSWEPALAVLPPLMRELAAGPCRATVVLSDCFVRYVLVPWNAQLATRAEDLAYARHCFETVHGEIAADWEIRLSPGRRDEPRIASAVDRQLIAELRTIFKNERSRLVSVQPLLMAAFNRALPQLDAAPGMVLAVSSGHYAYVSYAADRVLAVRSGGFGSTAEELAAIAERESIWSGIPQRPSVTVYAADGGLTGEVPDERLTVRSLSVQVPAQWNQADVLSYSLALSAP